MYNSNIYFSWARYSLPFLAWKLKYVSLYWSRVFILPYPQILALRAASLVSVYITSMSIISIPHQICSKHNTPISWPSLWSYSFPGSCSLFPCHLHAIERGGWKDTKEQRDIERGDSWSWILSCLVSSYGSLITLQLFIEWASKAVSMYI